MEVDGISYSFVVASDVQRDGIGLECTVEGNPEDLALEAFWHDPSGRFTFKAFRRELPFELVEEFVMYARERLPPRRSEDRAPDT